MSKIGFEPINNNYNSNNIIKKMSELDEDQQALIKSVDGATAPKYVDLAELQNSGNSSTYNQALHNITMVEVYKNSMPTVNKELNDQQIFVTSLRKIVEDFKSDFIGVSKNFPGVITKVELCDKTLNEIMNVLNTKNAEGKYLLGGVNSSDTPCLDLTTFSNLDAAGNALNNYTSTTPNVVEISVSNNSTIKLSLNATDNTFATLIGAINRIKSSPNIIPIPAELEVLSKELNAAVEGIDAIEATIINNRDVVKKAEVNNEAVIIAATDILSSATFVKSTNELVQESIDFARSKKILQLLQSLNYKTSNDLLKLISPAA